jgi:phosphoglycerate kinase
VSRRNIRQLDVKGKRVLCRVDFNVPLDEQGCITDDLRIQAALPTITTLLDAGARLILMSHLGRPKGAPEAKYSLQPAADRLAQLLGKSVKLSSDCVSQETREMALGLNDGEVLLLENLRFHAGETENDPAFVSQLAALGEIYVNDAFGTAHRAHASTEGVARALGNAAAGLLMERELEFLEDRLHEPARPYWAVLGGAKVSGKIDVIENLIPKVDGLVIGGGMVFTFFRAMGLETGSSLVEEDRIEMADGIIKRCQDAGVRLLLPTDIVIADAFSRDAAHKVVQRDAMPAGWMGLDIGPASIMAIDEALSAAKTVVWNGPMGVFEFEAFAGGTRGLAETLGRATAAGACTIVGGGDSAAAVKQFEMESDFTHISTGGGASLELLEGKELPGVAVLNR